MTYEDPLRPSQAAGRVLEHILNSRERFVQLAGLKPEDDEFKTGIKVIQSIYKIGEIKIGEIDSIKKVYNEIGFHIDRSLENPDSMLISSLGRLVNHYLGYKKD